MKPREIALTRMLRARWFAILLILLSFASAFFPDECRPISLTLADHRTLFPAPSRWIADPQLSRWLALAANLGVILVMFYINRRFNLLRTISLLFVAMYAVMESATPSSLMWFSGGQVAALTVIGCMGVMFSVYNRPELTRRVFLVFCLLASCSLTQIGFPVYLAVFLIGCAQMRVFSFRTFVAALLGIVTPLWIVFGAGVRSPHDFHIPPIVNPFSGVDLQVSLQLFLTVGFTLLVGVVTGVANLLRFMRMNAQTRSLNGLLGIIGITTGLMAVVDFTNIEFYIPLLNATTAFQTGHFFRMNQKRRAYILILVLLAVYSAMWLWKILL
ncbi:MAG: hypothetical protein NC336_09760 [Clostridium sp.]|nr:hypothetical protein [Clostridium sp.]